MRAGQTKRIFSTKHGRTGRKLLSAVALLSGLATMSIPANAAVFLRGYLTGVPSSSLTKADWDAFQNAAQNLLGQIPATPGQSQDWQGPSGAHGTLTIKRVFEKHDMPCREVNALFDAKKGPGGRNYMLTICRNNAGDWKLVN